MEQAEADKLELENALEFTALYRENAGHPPALRELNCLRFQFAHMFLPPEPGATAIGDSRDDFLGRPIAASYRVERSGGAWALIPVSSKY